MFMAEMLSPIAANPIYYSAPLFPGILYGEVYGLPWGILATLVIGGPIALQEIKRRPNHRTGGER